MSNYDESTIKLHRVGAEHRCSRCDNVIKIGEKVAYQKDPYVAIGVSRNESGEVCFNEFRQELAHFKTGRKPIPRSQKARFDK